MEGTLCILLAASVAKADLSRFPGKAACEAALKISEAWLEAAEAERKTCPTIRRRADLDEAMRQCRDRRDAWALLQEAYEECTDAAMRKLEECIGTARYYVGSMPAPTP